MPNLPRKNLKRAMQTQARTGRCRFAALTAACILAATFAVARAQPLPTYPELNPGSPALLAEVVRLHQQAEESLAEQNWLQAELLLERILMLQPENAHALLQMAMVLQARNRSADAQAIIAALRDDERTAAEHRQRLQVLLDSQNQIQNVNPDPASGPTSGSQPRAQLLVSLGRGSNPLARPSAHSIHLTLPSGTLSLQLDQRPVAANTTSVVFYQQFANGLELVASNHHVAAPGAHASARLALAGPLAPGWLWSLSSQQGIDGARRDSIGLMHSHTGPRAQQLYTVSAFRASSDDSQGLLARAQSSIAPLAVLQFDGWLEFERTRPSHALRLGMQAQWRLPQRWQLQSYLLLQQDLSGYSPWLEHGATRRIVTSHIALEKSWPLPSGELVTSVYRTQRTSNLPLFAWRDHGLVLGWRRAW